MRLTKEQRDRLDCDLLLAFKTDLGWRGSTATAVLRNILDWPGAHWHRKGLETSDVLRACRRNGRRGLMEEGSTSYAVQKSWQLTNAGRAAADLPAGRSALRSKGESDV